MNPIQSSWLALKAIYGFFVLVRNPSKLDRVFAILDSLEESPSGAEIVKEFAQNPLHAHAFKNRPTMRNTNIKALAALPYGTLGRTFADEFQARGLRLEDIQMRPDDGTDRGYVFQHLRETHDVWHTATGFDVDVAGELGLQAFYLTQFNARLSLVILAIGFLNTFLFSPKEREARMDAIAKGWQMGRAGKSLFGYDWAANWEKPLSEVRRELGLVVPDPRTTTLAPMRRAVMLEA